MFDSIKKRAKSLMDHALEITGAIIAVAVGVGYVAAPIFFATNTTGWDATSQIIWPVLFVLALVAILFGLLYMARHKGAA